MSAARDQHIAWLEQRLAEAEDRMDALLYGQLDLSAAYARVLDLPYAAADGSWQGAGHGEAIDLAGDDADDWDETENLILGAPEDRLRGTWNGLDRTPYGREPTSTAEMSAAVSDAQQAEIARLRREVSLAQASEADLIDEWYARTGARR